MCFKVSNTQRKIVFQSARVRAQNIYGLKYCNEYIMLESSNHENDVKLYLGKT